MTRALTLLSVLALMILTGLPAPPARAETVHSWGYFPEYSSTIRLQPTDAPGAVAEVRFVNKTVHMDETVLFTLDLDGLVVTIEAQVGQGMTPDRMTVTPPDGFIAVPPQIDVAEDQAGVVLIYQWNGM
jgi:hypothetical protein